LSRGFEHPCSCERLKDAFGDASRPFAQTEHPGGIATRIDLDHLGANGDLDAISRQASKHATNWRAQRDLPNCRDDSVFLDSVTDVRTSLKTTGGRRVDEARAPDPAD
jgi:hypothetical protein